MNRQLIFIHGRAQEFKDAGQLKAEWIRSWEEGLKLSGLKLPIPEKDIRFPYYGQTLHDLVERVPNPADIIVKGSADQVKEEFIASVMQEVQEVAGITDEQIMAAAEIDIQEKGPLNWRWVRGILQAVDRYVPGGSSNSIALATNDVYQYLNSAGIRDAIDSGVLTAINPDREAVVVSHSLGTVVAYNLLRGQGEARGWKIPLFVTLGSPLAVKAIKKAVRPIEHPSCAGKWYNAMDPRDIVALRPLDARNFDIDPSIENKTNVDNPTSNRHGISGYLGDKEVAKKIYDALVG